MKTTQIATLSFPETNIRPRDARKLRGYFSKRFGEESELFHNHEKDGRVIWRYPLIQYKVVNHCPTVQGIGEGASLIIQKFSSIDKLELGGQTYPAKEKKLESQKVEIGVDGGFNRYAFTSPWMALNQDNYAVFQKITDKHEQNDFLSKTLRGNILTMFKALGHWEAEQVEVAFQLSYSRTVWFKNIRMKAFHGSFVSNAQIPNFIGVGKSPSRGFGVVQSTGR